MPKLRAIVALGRIAHETLVRRDGVGAATIRSTMAACGPMGEIALFDSYHCSRYNTITGVLTPQMFRDVFAKVRSFSMQLSAFTRPRKIEAS